MSKSNFDKLLEAVYYPALCSQIREAIPDSIVDAVNGGDKKAIAFLDIYFKYVMDQQRKDRAEFNTANFNKNASVLIDAFVVMKTCCDKPDMIPVEPASESNHSFCLNCHRLKKDSMCS